MNPVTELYFRDLFLLLLRFRGLGAKHHPAEAAPEGFLSFKDLGSYGGTEF